MVLFSLSIRSNSSQNLIVKPSILLLLHIITCETHQYCNNRFLGYKGLLNRVQSNLNIIVNSLDFKIATVNYEEFIQKKKKKHKISLNFANKNTKNLIYLRLANCVYIYIYTHTHIFRNKIYNLHQLRNNIISIKRLHIVLKSTTTYIS